MNVQKIMLGSAQFGMSYGIANRQGQLSEKNIKKIFELAAIHKIDSIDTASQYGSSEAIIGKLSPVSLKIFTKLRPLIPGMNDINDFVSHQLNLSLGDLKRPSIEGLLVHHADDLLGPKGEFLYEALIEAKLNKKIKKIGVSVYFPEQVYRLMNRYSLDVIQFPLNIFDQRFLNNSLILELCKKNIELHARSIFMQGLLLMQPDHIPSYFDKIKKSLHVFQTDCETLKISAQQALIEFATSIKEIKYYIIGIDNHLQFSEIISYFSHSQSICRIDFEKFRCEDLDMINPMRWKIT
jgi:aryl-alcohol dehydrogenase-like predicted oxidoreductase